MVEVGRRSTGSDRYDHGMSSSKYSLGDDVFPAGGVRGRIVEIKILEGGKVVYGIEDATGAVKYHTEASLRLMS